MFFLLRIHSQNNFVIFETLVRMRLRIGLDVELLLHLIS